MHPTAAHRWEGSCIGAGRRVKGCKVRGAGSRAWDERCGVQSLEFGMWGAGYGMWGAGYGMRGAGYGMQGAGCCLHAMQEPELPLTLRSGSSTSAS